jgi:hypothetical protein
MLPPPVDSAEPPVAPAAPPAPERLPVFPPAAVVALIFSGVLSDDEQPSTPTSARPQRARARTRFRRGLNPVRRGLERAGFLSAFTAASLAPCMDGFSRLKE